MSFGLSTHIFSWFFDDFECLVLFLNVDFESSIGTVTSIKFAVTAIKT